LSELLLFDLGSDDVEPEIVDAREVSNYVVALETGLVRLQELPIGTRLIRELHRLLLEGVRGQGGAGEFRRLQVHIGPTMRIADATFIPPPANEIDPLMSALEKFIHAESDLPALVRMALIHYQFETIHPFHDGNGRVGRLLVSLLLSAERVLDQPLLYLSAYFERHREQYYRSLRRVSTDGAWSDWLLYFLEAVRVQSLEAVRSAGGLLTLRDEYHQRLHVARSSALVHRLIDELFVVPAVTVTRVAKMLDLTHRGAQQNVEKLIEAKILREITGRRRNRIFLAEEIIRAIEA
jgi:Fic family protein